MTFIYYVPYIYLPTNQVAGIAAVCYRYLSIIKDIHNGVPNRDSTIKNVRPYIYHPSVLSFLLNKSINEYASRKRINKTRWKLSELKLRSRPISEMLPPKEEILVSHLISLFWRWKGKLLPGGKKIPKSYLDLIRKYDASYNPEGEACKRIDFLSESHYNDDRWWYND